MSHDLYDRIEKWDKRGVHYDFQPTGELLVANNPDFECNFPVLDIENDKVLTDRKVTDWDLGVAKPGDVGIDIPVRIRGMKNVLDPNGKPYLQVSPEPPVHNYLINYDKAYVDIPSNGYAELPSALHLKIPEDAWGMIRPRSSTGWKRRLVTFEGTIDSGFCGMICCLVHNPNTYKVRLMHDDCVAQLVLVPKYPLDKITYIDYNNLPKTQRGHGGFGSTGK